MAVLARDEPRASDGGAAPRRDAAARLFDAALAACIVGWGLGALRQGSVVGYAIAALHFTVAGLVFIRRPERGPAPLAGIVLSLPAVAVGAIALVLAPHPSTWPGALVGAFVVSVGAALVSLLVLGRSFAILPSRRALVTRLAYRVVRHPIYASELAMVCLGAGTLDWRWGSVVSVAAIAAIVVRIEIEERLWAADPNYLRYQAEVPWKLVPGVW